MSRNEALRAVVAAAKTVRDMLELGDQRLLASDGPAGGQLPDLSPKEWGKVYRACKKIAAIEAAIGTTPEAGKAREHVWHPDYDEEQGRVVESCFNCGVSRECFCLRPEPSDPQGGAMSEYDPQDAFGLLRSYSRHRDYIRLALRRVENDLHERAIVHDASKMLDDEFGGFSRINAAARIQKFGSPEYKEGMKRERPTIDLHFSRNSHHPENGQPMTFLDVIEMVCDWWGAGKGYDDPRPWAESAALNFESKGKYLTPEQRWLAEQVVAFLAHAK